MDWQANLAKQYGVSNFVVFHYWYEGRLLLEKPIEQLMNHPEIDFPFCFCWANHSWTRAWDGKDHEMLVEQTYGGLDEWERHFAYLVRFFKDRRYRKINNKPVLFIYKASSIPDGDARIAYWNKRAIDEGFSGLYIVEYINTFNRKPSLNCSQAVFEDEPNYVNRFMISPIAKALRVFHKTTKTTDYQSFDRTWKYILGNSRLYGDRAIMNGAFGMWDNSPRKGKNSRILLGASPERLKENLTKLIQRDRCNDSGIIVFNAWNEWGEGAILEPTEQFGFKYLEAIRDSLELSRTS